MTIELSTVAIGFGTWPMQDDDAQRAVAAAIDNGYRLIDTASKYENEEAVGRGIRASGIAREDVLIQTKLRGHDHDDVRGALQRSLEWLGVEYLDSWLIHWPLPMLDLYPQAFEEMAKARDEGLVREIGVSNFLGEHLDKLKQVTGLVPAVNQIACDPGLSRPELRADIAARGIGLQAWSPLARGGVMLQEEPVQEAARQRGVSAAEVVLAWHRAIGSVPIVRSTNSERQRQNLQAVNIELAPEEIARISSVPQRELGDFDPSIRDER